MDKYSNKAIIGNKKIVAGFTDKGELQRFCYPYIDGRQFVDFFHVGLKINDSNIVYLHNDINNVCKQYYMEDSNILVTDIENKYFNLKINQIDYCVVSKDVLVKKYILANNNSIDLNLNFIVNSKVLANSLVNYASRIFENGVIQYNHNHSFSIFSKERILGHKLNDVSSIIESGIINDKDYIGMSNEVAVSYDLGTLKPGESKNFYLYVYASENNSNLEEDLFDKIKIDDEKELEETKKFWKSYVSEHSSVKLKNENLFNKKILEIYNRTILLYPLLINYDYGGVAAALEVDDKRSKSGGYRYCWTRDAIFITKAFDLLKMEEDSERFYNKFCQNTQSKNGMWEQRFFTDGKLAPCWGYQVDETASVIFGVFNHYEVIKNKDFLKKNLKMCEKATKFLFQYVDNLLNIDEADLVKKELEDKYKKVFDPAKHVSYDLWEMNEGVHIYSISGIIAGFESMKKIYEELYDENENNARLKIEKRTKLISKLNKYIELLNNFIKSDLVDPYYKILKRNLNDSKMDISVMGAVYPFQIFDTDDKVIKNTVDKINMTLRTYKNGYLRFEQDTYMGGNNPWVITTLWMALYYIKSGEISKAEDCFKFVVDTSSKYGFLSEQVNNDNPDFQWVIGLGWSHAMFIIVLNELLKCYEEKEG